MHGNLPVKSLCFLVAFVFCWADCVNVPRAHKHFITPEAYALRNKCKLGDNRSFLVLYANGKSAVRVDAPGARQLGPHYFKGDDSPR